MAFLAKITASKALDQIISNAAQLKTIVDNSAEKMNGTVDAGQIWSLRKALEGKETIFLNLQSTPGIVQLAKDQYDDQTYDIVAEFTAMRNELTTTITQIDSLIPKCADPSILAIVSDQWEFKLYTPAQTAPLHSQLQVLSGTISIV